MAAAALQGSRAAPSPLAPGAGLFLVVFPLFLTLRPGAAQVGPPDSGALGLSLHPPYFNLAETASIRATATCGEEESGGGRPRPELYCKLVGGPAASPAGHTIQVPPLAAAGIPGRSAGHTGGPG